MKRRELFEFEDFHWFPQWLRTCMTNLLVLLQKMLGTADVLSVLIGKLLKDQGISKIVDLGSGSGGVMPEVLLKLRKDEQLKETELILTDLFPNAEIVEKINEDCSDGISYHKRSVDATEISAAPTGLKTMINSFHHMRPEQAKKILASAQQNNQPLLIYELGDNKIPLILWAIMLPIGLIILMIMVLFMTPFVRPLSWQQLVFTYIIPLIPICYAWDGQASLPRIYSLEDLEVLLDGLSSDSYQWIKGHAKKNNKNQGIYLMGVPK